MKVFNAIINWESSIVVHRNTVHRNTDFTYICKTGYFRKKMLVLTTNNLAV